jgi:hypothetical protein
MKLKTIVAIPVLVILQGCAGINVAMISERDAKGKDVDQVVAELKARGLSCGQEYREKLITGQSSRYLTVACTTKDIGPICPDSYRVYVDFIPETRMVSSLSKFSKTNCF